MPHPLPGSNLSDATWPFLLAHWTDFAKSSVALPAGVQGDRWRGAVAPIIGLQAVTFALGDLATLRSIGERALALDKAELLTRKHAGELGDLWGGEALHVELASLIGDAQGALAAARNGGLEWRVPRVEGGMVGEHPAELVADLLGAGFGGDLLLAVPGVRLFPGAPLAFARAPLGADPAEDEAAAISGFLGGRAAGPSRVPRPRQVCRQYDFAKGRAVRDVVAPMGGSMPGGQPQLVWAIQKGGGLPVTLPIRGMDEQEELPVVVEGDPGDAGHVKG